MKGSPDDPGAIGFSLQSVSQYHLVSHRRMKLPILQPEQEGENVNRKSGMPPWQERQLSDGSICFTVKTLGVVSIAQDGFAAAERCRKKDPRRARRLRNLAETLLSAAVVVLRHEEAKVPQEVLEAISELTSELRKPVARTQRSA